MALRAAEYDIIAQLPNLPYLEYVDGGNSGLGTIYQEWLDGECVLRVPGDGEVEFAFRDPSSEATSQRGRKAIAALACSMWQL
jgi:hypothetical protein